MNNASARHEPRAVRTARSRPSHPDACGRTAHDCLLVIRHGDVEIDAPPTSYLLSSPLCNCARRDVNTRSLAPAFCLNESCLIYPPPRVSVRYSQKLYADGRTAHVPPAPPVPPPPPPHPRLTFAPWRRAAAWSAACQRARSAARVFVCSGGWAGGEPAG